MTPALSYELSSPIYTFTYLGIRLFRHTDFNRFQ